MNQKRAKELIVKYYKCVLNDINKDVELWQSMECTPAELDYVKENYEDLFLKYKNSIFEELGDRCIVSDNKSELRDKLLTALNLNGDVYNEDIKYRCLKVVSDSVYKPTRIRLEEGCVVLQAKDIVYKITEKGMALRWHIKNRVIDSWFEGKGIYDKISKINFWNQELLNMDPIRS